MAQADTLIREAVPLARDKATQGQVSRLVSGVAFEIKHNIPFMYAVLLPLWYWVVTTYYPGWHETFVARFGHWLGPPLLVWVSHLAWYHGYAGLHEVCDSVRGPWDHYKLHTRDTMTYWQLLPNVVRNQVLFLLLGFVLSGSTGGLGGAKAGRGYQRPDDVLPLSSFMAQGSVALGSYELLFYYAHKFLHIKNLRIPLLGLQIHPYRQWHKLHHLTFASKGVSALYMTWVDILLTQAFPQQLAPCLFNLHPTVLFFATCVGSLNAVHTHSCYQIPGMPHPNGHELHHSLYDINFGTGALDKLLDTYLEEADVHRAKAGLGQRGVPTVIRNAHRLKSR